jgi:cyclopropane-fatty-acyl-phospholipid synthase
MKPSDYSRPLNTGRSSDGHWLEHRFLRVLRRQLDALDYGVLDLQLPDGDSASFGRHRPGEAHAQVRLNSYRALRRLLRGGMIGWAEAYMAGEWDSPDLAALVQWALGNEHAMQQFMRGNLLLRLTNRLFHLSRRNSRRGSRRNIEYHYDLGNDFYRLWLDPSMTYSSALFAGNESLQAAQHNKYRRIAQMLGLKPGQRVLEIGCGWGGFAELAAREFGVQVHGITLSQEQLAWARNRVANAGLTDRCHFSLTDYRDLDTQYDHIVSIEMFEAVGEAHWDLYFQTLKRCLRPGGQALLQVISIDNERFARYRRSADFIQRYIFPGGMLPSPAVLAERIGANGLALREQQLFGADYARTLAIWHQRFNDQWPAIRALGFDDRFRRMWQYYLGYCEGGFRGGSIDVGLYRIGRAE